MHTRTTAGFALLTVILCCLASSTVAGDPTDYSKGEYGAIYGNAYGFFGEDEYRIFGIQMGSGETFCKGAVEYDYNAFLGASWVKREGVRRFSFQSAVNIVALSLTAIVDQTILKGDDRPFTQSPARFFFFAPNSAWKFRLFYGCQVGMRFNTEYLFVRHAGADRGIVFLPAAEVTIYKHNWLGRGGLTFHVGQALFWNLEGADEVDGVAVGVTFFGDGSTM